MKTKIRISVMMKGFFGGRAISFNGELKLKQDATLEVALQKLGKKVRLDLLSFVRERANPVIMLSGQRVELPDDYQRKLNQDDELAIFQPMAGG